MKTPQNRNFVLLGAGGHARVLLSLMRAAGHVVLGVCDPQLGINKTPSWEGLHVIGNDAALAKQFGKDQIVLALGVGQLCHGTLRERIYDHWRSLGYDFPALVHPSAWLADDAVLADGVQIMAGAIIQPCCIIGENSIINTRASIDHDCQIGSNVHVAPGATLCGAVRVSNGSFIGAGAVITQDIRIGERAVVGAGTTLVRDLDSYQTIIGGPQRLSTHSSCVGVKSEQQKRDEN